MFSLLIDTSTISGACIPSSSIKLTRLFHSTVAVRARTGVPGFKNDLKVLSSPYAALKAFFLGDDFPLENKTRLSFQKKSIDLW